MSTEDLPPTQYLVMEVLAARYRTGERLWTFPTSLRPAVEQLAQRQLIGWKSGVAPASIQAWLTDKGCEHLLKPDYKPPALREWSDIAYELWALACNSAPFEPRFADEWTAARDRLRDRFHLALGALHSGPASDGVEQVDLGTAPHSGGEA